MNILMELTTSNHRIWHSMAKRLKEIYPDAKFGGIVGVSAGCEYTIEFLRNQKDIHYEFLYLHSEIVKEAFNGEIDWNVLKKFEQNLPGKSLWRLVAADRGWGSSYLHGVIINESFSTVNNSRENILKVFSGCIKKYRSIFNDFKVDLFLPAICMGSIPVFIFEELCKERGLPYIVPSFIRINNLFAFASDVQLNYAHIDEMYRQSISGRRPLDLTKAQKLYQELMSELENSKNFDRFLPGIRNEKLTTLRQKLKIVLAMGRSVLGAIKLWIKRRDFNKSDDIRRQPYKLSILWSNITKNIRFHYQRFVLLDPNFGEILPPEQKYIYYPLHTSPEYSTNFQATMWMNQLANIELLSKSIPSDWVVYVKEHPATLPGRVRPLQFLKDIVRYPNVRMAPLDLDTHHIISNAQMVAVVTGTSAWEAIQRGTPVITFARNYFDVLELSRVCSNPERLSNDIQEELVRSRAIPLEERKKRLTHYLAAILEQAFEVTYPAQFSYEQGTIEQFEVCGAETADALKKHLDFLALHKEEAVR
jgi:hypothetical protein